MKKDRKIQSLSEDAKIKIPKLTKSEMENILSNKSELTVEVYKKIYEWGEKNLSGKNKGHIHLGSTTLNLEGNYSQYGYGTNGFIYSYTGKKGPELGKYFLFRISVDGNFSPSLFWNTLNYSEYNKQPMNNLSFQEEFIQRFFNIGIDYSENNPFLKRDVFDNEIDFFTDTEKLESFFSIWDWVIEEIEYSIDSKKELESIKIDNKNDNVDLDLSAKKRKSGGKKKNYTKTETRHQQSVFRRGVLERYGVKCAFCDIKNINIIEAAHIIPYSNNSQFDIEILQNPKNGISLCRNHHRLFDKDLVFIDPETLNILSFDQKINLLDEFKITEKNLNNLEYLPDKNCLAWRMNNIPKFIT